MKIKLNRENIKKTICKHPYRLTALATATVIAFCYGTSELIDYTNRPNAIGSYVSITDNERTAHKIEIQSEERQLYDSIEKEIDKKYIYEDTEKLAEILEDIKSDDYTITYEHENDRTIALHVELSNQCIKQEGYKDFNKQLSKIFSNINICSLNLNGLDLSKLDHSLLKKIEVNKLVLKDCVNDFDYKYFDTSTINELWLYGRYGYQEANEHYDLREYSYTKKLIISGDASFKNLEKMVSLEDFTLFNRQNMKEKEYQQVISSLNELYKYKLTPFYSLKLFNPPTRKIVLPNANYIYINELSYIDTCDIIVNTNHLTIDNMSGGEYSTKVNISGYIGEHLDARCVRISQLNINDINRFGEDITYFFTDSHLDMELEEVNDRFKNASFDRTYLTGYEETEIKKTEDGVKFIVNEHKIKVKE